MAKIKKYTFVPGLGMVSNQRTFEKEILTLISTLRLSYYKKYLIILFETLNDKALTGFKKNLQNKNASQVEFVIIKYLNAQGIEFLEREKDIQSPVQKDKNKKAVSKHRLNTTRKPFSVLLTDKTKEDLKALKTQYNFKTMEDLLLYFMKNHSKPYSFRFKNTYY